MENVVYLSLTNAEFDTLITDQKPLFKVHQSYSASIFVIGVLLFFSSLLILFADSLFVRLIGIALTAAPLLIAIVAFLYSSDYEFYERFFLRKYRRSIRNEIPYSQVRGMRFFHHAALSRYSPRDRIILTALDEGIEYSFIINGNPQDKNFGMSLADWLESKILESGGRV